MAKKAVTIANVKGGTGKTLVSVNLARRLVSHGRTALIDADLDNANFAQFTGSKASIGVTRDHQFRPYDWDGIQVFSMSLLGARDQSVSMEASRYVQILDDVIERSMWDAEFFVIDMPGGGSDIFRAGIEIFGEYLVGSVIVSQPSMVDSTRKALNLHRYFEIPVLGLIENMSWFQAGAVRYHPFGRSTVDGIAEEYGVPVLGRIPLSVEIAEGISRGDPIIPGAMAEPIEVACKAVVSARIQRPGFLDRVVERVGAAIKGEVEKLLVHFVVNVNKGFNIGAMRTKTGFREGKPFLFVITDETGDVELTRVALQVGADRLYVLRNPEKLDFQIATDFRTLARMIMGKARKRGELVDFDPWDAWFNGDIKAYGLGYTPRCVRALREIFGDETTMSKLRSRFGSVLKGWL